MPGRNRARFTVSSNTTLEFYASFALQSAVGTTSPSPGVRNLRLEAARRLRLAPYVGRSLLRLRRPVRVGGLLQKF